MIELTRVGSGATFFLNPDLIERIDTHVDTVVRLTNGIEYVVAESGDEIVDRIIEYRGRIMNVLPTVGGADDDPPGPDSPGPDTPGPDTAGADTPRAVPPDAVDSAEHEAAR